MADKDKQPEALAPEDFMTNVQQAMGISAEPEINDEMDDTQKRVSALEHENGQMKFQMQLEKDIQAFKSNFPKATEAQLQDFILNVAKKNPQGTINAIKACLLYTSPSPRDS